jgi:hypothetical protein
VSGLLRARSPESSGLARTWILGRDWAEKFGIRCHLRDSDWADAGAIIDPRRVPFGPGHPASREAGIYPMFMNILFSTALEPILTGLTGSTYFHSCIAPQTALLSFLFAGDPPNLSVCIQLSATICNFADNISIAHVASPDRKKW